MNAEAVAAPGDVPTLTGARVVLRPITGIWRDCLLMELVTPPADRER